MVYLGFKKGESVFSTNEDPKLEQKDSIVVNENLLEIIKKDEKTPGLYSEFSHQQLNKQVFEANKEKEDHHENIYQIHEPATTMQRDLESLSHDVDPDNLICLENFNKYLHEERVPAGPKDEETVWGTFDLRLSERQNVTKDENSLMLETKLSENQEKPDWNQLGVQTNVTALPLGHSFTQDFVNNLEQSKIAPQSLYFFNFFDYY